ncbi:unnamed protein product [Chondrus crispus]|uniref:SRP54-type proteins GTP-binding domain-containing protein n=1 Tax=Chondrus crispus TaxID=2769 RepID=R7QFU0_CHOCR|nr:unnamed protein product [Chondrus crispus]CDF36623.1 unnamed protein product [Chondrus crispus]|eukprot:XP_005716442.1 unnamed protein product [Chondrus crispus]
MIDEFCIFESGGTVLWRRSFVALKGDPLAILVRSVLLEDRLSLPELSFDCYTLRWVLDNERGLFFVVIFQRLLPPAYADDLLHMVRKEFTKRYIRPADNPSAKGNTPFVVDCDPDFDQFAPHFERILASAEKKSMTAGATSRNAEGKKRKPVKPPAPDITSPDPNREAEQDPETLDTGLSTLSAEDVVKKNREAFIRKHVSRKSKAAMGAMKMKPKPSAIDSATTPTRSVGGKVMRPSNKATQDAGPTLDYSTGKPQEDGAIADDEVARFRDQFMNAAPNSAYDIIEDSDDDEFDEEDGDGVNESSAPLGGVLNYFKGLAGMRNLTKADLQPVMENFKDVLIAKNVAQNIAEKLIESVLNSLEGKKMESMTSVTTTVRSALDEALTRILTSRQSTDIVAEIAAKQGTGRPYVITYCGVNGVGKSTSLAKTCYYLLNHGYKVMIAACDTFRAGAVEQLRTHVRCLGEGVELFDRGYGKDAAAVANDAIRKAKELGYDVVLVDTAGRMQDNEPLMRALAKLVEVNRPDRVLFVGEALVGNDAVDQLSKFNQALADHQNAAAPRLIDGIVLTKFDTIDDKVGAAVSMVYATGQPIVFVGVGQTYMDLRKINTRSLVKALLK